VQWLTPVSLAIQEVEVKGTRFEASWGQMFTRPPSQLIKARGWWYVPVILAKQEAERKSRPAWA
jgi:hypothetical protein